MVNTGLKLRKGQFCQFVYYSQHISLRRYNWSIQEHQGTKRKISTFLDIEWITWVHLSFECVQPEETLTAYLLKLSEKKHFVEQTMLIYMCVFLFLFCFKPLHSDHICYLIDIKYLVQWFCPNILHKMGMYSHKVICACD